MITLLTNNSPRSYELMSALDEADVEYEVKETKRHDAPVLIVLDKEYRFNQAFKWIRKRVKKNGDII